MSEPTVSVDFVIRTARGVYTIAEATLEKNNLETALKDVQEKLALIEAAKED